MITFSHPLAYGHWLAFACILIIIELLSMTTFLLGMGLAALMMALVAFIAKDLSGNVQFAIFGVLSLINILIGNHFFKSKATGDKANPFLNQRNRQYIGRQFTLDEPIFNGTGAVKVDDTKWRVKGHDLPTGTVVKVVDVDGVFLIVERCEQA